MNGGRNGSQEFDDLGVSALGIHGREPRAHALPHLGRQGREGGVQERRPTLQAIAAAEQVHATNHFHAIGGETGAASVAASGIFGDNSTADNLRGAIEGELGEVEQMYPVYLNAAEFQNEPDARRSFHGALEAEKQHAALYQQALEAVLQGKDVELGTIYICPVCGYTVVGDAPERCPVCGAPRETFLKF